MGRTYLGLKEFNESAPFSFYANPENSMRLFVVGETEEQRSEGAEAARTTLEGVLQEAQQGGEISRYEIEEVDLAINPEEADEMMSSYVWEKLDDEDSGIYVPIFHNADNHPDLAQALFDGDYRGVLTVSREGYDAVTNKSKRGTFSALHIR